MIHHRDVGIKPQAKVPSNRHRVNVGITYANMGDNYLIKLLRCTNNNGFVVKRLLNLKKCLKKWRGEFKKKRNCFDKGRFGDRMFAHSGAKVQSRYFYLGDLVTSTVRG